jgi:hypothetical protein
MVRLYYGMWAAARALAKCRAATCGAGQRVLVRGGRGRRRWAEGRAACRWGSKAWRLPLLAPAKGETERETEREIERETKKGISGNAPTQRPSLEDPPYKTLPTRLLSKPPPPPPHHYTRTYTCPTSGVRTTRRVLNIVHAHVHTQYTGILQGGYLAGGRGGGHHQALNRDKGNKQGHYHRIALPSFRPAKIFV